jgi:monoamine oxidase
MGEKSVIIIGAGIAGLSAAYDLSGAGWNVVILEARERIGGRICTIPQSSCGPIELGAEFVHGARNDVWPLLEAAGIATHQVPDRHWQIRDGQLAEDQSSDDWLDEVRQRAGRSEPDRSVDDYLELEKGLAQPVRESAREYVEGFHAADPKLMSLQALAEAERAAEEMQGDRNFRVTHGYGALVNWLHSVIESRSVKIHCHAIAKLVRWQQGQVEVETEQDGRNRVFCAARLLVTVPPGVLRSAGTGRLSFHPEIPDQMEAMAGFEMGHVAKIVLRFRCKLWPVESFGFIHTNDKWLPTWWADERGLILTGWAGGPRGQHLSKAGADYISSQAVRVLADAFALGHERVASALEKAAFHNWSEDPFSCGAYSYIKVGMAQAPNFLRAPVAETIFFAGEALASRGQQGTVHGAIESGRAAAGMMCSQDLAIANGSGVNRRP